MSKRSNKSTSRRIIVSAVVYGGGHVRCLKPILETLNSGPNVEVHVLALTTAYEELRDTSLKLHRFQDIPVPKVMSDRARTLGLQFLETINPHPDVPRSESCAYLGLNLLELIDQYPSEKDALEAFRMFGRQIFLPVRSLKYWLKAIAPDALLTTTSPRAEKASIIVASELNIPTIVVVDLFAEGPEFEWLSNPDLGHYLCVMNRVVWNRFRGKIDAKFLIEAINPAFVPPTTLRRQIVMRTGKLRILWAPSPEPAINPKSGTRGDVDWPKRLGVKLSKVFSPLDSVELAMRPHPNHPNTVPDNCVLDSYPDIWESLSQTDILITTVSTVAIQAQALKIPTIVIKGSVVDDHGPLIDHGYATRTVGEEDLHLLGCERYLNETLDMEIGRPDLPTDSTEKISTLVMNLVESSRVVLDKNSL